MLHLHYFSSATQEYLTSLGATCHACGSDQPGEYGWWEVGYRPTCTSCTMLAERVAEAVGEPLVLGQVLTQEQLLSQYSWEAEGIGAN